jgi:chaperonin GroEL
MILRAMPDPRILNGAPARQALYRGVDQMARLIRPTLGPNARTVMIAHILQGKNPPEILDSGATIARRTIQIPDPFEDMGAMLLRHAVWQTFEAVGDGTATTAVIAHQLLREAERYLAAGASPVGLRRGLERGLEVALAELDRQARPIELPAEIAGVVAGIVRDPKVAEIVGEVIDSVGPDGAVLVEDSAGTETVYEYIDGIRWNEGYVSPFFVKDGTGGTVRLIEPRIFVTDHYLEKAEQLMPAVEACVQAGGRTIMVIAPEVRGEALSLLLVNLEKDVLDGALAVKAPGFGTQRTRVLEDIAVATGGRCILEDVGELPQNATADDLGSARQGWATNRVFGILGGRGSKEAIRRRVADARAELRTADQDDQHMLKRIRERIGKLSGTAAVILAGAPTSPERDELKLRIEAAVATARAAVEDGVVAGGGAALLACAPAVERAAELLELDEASGARALARALAEPMRAIADNAGLEPSHVLHEARCRGPERTFDVLREEWVDAWEAGLLDPLGVTRHALETGVSAAATALTADVLIHRKKPPTATKP